MRGPIDFIIVGFEGDKFDGSILRSLAEAIDNKIIELVTLAFIRKDAQGNVSVLDIEKSGNDYAAEFAMKYKQQPDKVTDEDINEMADLLENNTAAGLLVIEQLWAKPLKKALLDANGVLVAEGRIHPEAANELDKEGS